MRKMAYKVLDSNNEIIAVCDSFIEAFSHVPCDSDAALIRDDSNHIAFMFKKGSLNGEIVLKNRK
jgi:transcriptional regulator of met regulon